MQKALMSCPVFLDFIGLNCKNLTMLINLMFTAHNDIKRKIISELLNRTKETQINFDIGPIRKI